MTKMLNIWCTRLLYSIFTLYSLCFCPWNLHVCLFVCMGVPVTTVWYVPIAWSLVWLTYIRVVILACKCHVIFTVLYVGPHFTGQQQLDMPIVLLICWGLKATRMLKTNTVEHHFNMLNRDTTLHAVSC